MGRIIVILVGVFACRRHPASCRLAAMVLVTSLDLCANRGKRLKVVPDDEQVGKS